MDSSNLFSHPYEQTDTPPNDSSADRVQAPVFSDHSQHDHPSGTRSS